MKNEFATISTRGECEIWKLPISRQVYDAYVMAMEAAAQDDDGETAHRNADRLLTDLLEALGCKEIVNAFYDVTRWYS